MFTFGIEPFVQIFFSILKAIFSLFVIVAISYVIEKLTKIRIIIYNYNWKKSTNNAEGASIRDSVLFFVLNIIVYIYDIVKGNVTFNIFSFILWLVLIHVLKHYFYKIHKKYQAVDPNKDDDDFS